MHIRYLFVFCLFLQTSGIASTQSGKCITIGFLLTGGGGGPGVFPASRLSEVHEISIICLIWCFRP